MCLLHTRSYLNEYLNLLITDTIGTKFSINKWLRTGLRTYDEKGQAQFFVIITKLCAHTGILLIPALEEVNA